MFSKSSVEEIATIRNRTPLSRSSIFDYIRLATRYLALCFKIKNERRALAEFTNAELQDIGLHPADVAAECKRSFFDVPADRWYWQ